MRCSVCFDSVAQFSSALTQACSSLVALTSPLMESPVAEGFEGPVLPVPVSSAVQAVLVSSAVSKAPGVAAVVKSSIPVPPGVHLPAVPEHSPLPVPPDSKHFPPKIPVHEHTFQYIHLQRFLTTNAQIS